MVKLGNATLTTLMISANRCNNFLIPGRRTTARLRGTSDINAEIGDQNLHIGDFHHFNLEHSTSMFSENLVASNDISVKNRFNRLETLTHNGNF